MENQAETNLMAQEQSNAMESPKRERVTPEKVNKVHNNEVYVFSSNLQGLHNAGTARIAFQRYGAVMGQSVGLQGKCYAIPTLPGEPGILRPYVDEFLDFARQHPELTFLVTAIGADIAGYTPQDTAPLFRKAVKMPNVNLPQEYWEVLG